MHLRDLRASITDMDYTMRLDLMLSIRASRRVSKKITHNNASGTRKPMGRKNVDLDAVLKTMPKEQLMKLLGGL